MTVDQIEEEQRILREKVQAVYHEKRQKFSEFLIKNKDILVEYKRLMNELHQLHYHINRNIMAPVMHYKDEQEILKS